MTQDCPVYRNELKEETAQAFIWENYGIHERAKPGYTYIYAYSCGCLYLYVGQTIQSIHARYRLHFADDSGAHYADRVHYFQVRSEYANYAEGLIARTLCGICQGNVPNPDKQKNEVPEDVRSILTCIARDLYDIQTYHKTPTMGSRSVYFAALNGDGDYRVLSLMGKLADEDSVLRSQYSSLFQEPSHVRIRFETRCTYRKIVPVMFLIEEGKKSRIMMLLCLRNAKGIREVLDLRTDIPTYCIFEENYLEKYGDRVYRLFEHNGFGILKESVDSVEVVRPYQKDFRKGWFLCREVLRFYREKYGQWEHRSPYSFRRTPYNSFRVV